DMPSSDPKMIEKLARFGRQPEGLSDFHVFYPASCSSDKAGSETFSVRLADFETSVIGELLQVSVPERNALLDCVDYLNTKARTKAATTEKEGLQTLLDASPQVKLPFTLRSLRERATERSSKGTDVMDYSGLMTKLGWLMQTEAFDQINMPSLDPVRMMVPGR